ncbi:MAG: carboxypeptidase regulatory-like domain-containing protein [bacterium]
MSMYESEDFVRFSLRTAARRLGCIWLMVLLIIVGRSLAQAASLTASAATGAIQGKITDQSGQRLTNIQVLAVQQQSGTAAYTPFPYDLGAFPPWMPEELSNDPDLYLYPYRSYGAPGLEYTPPQVYKTLSEADGTFLLGSLPDGRYRLWAYDPQGRGFAPAIFGLDAGQGGGSLSSYSYPAASSILIRVHAGQTAGPISLTMTLGGKLSGQVTDAATGKPISGARITASSQNTPPGFCTLSDSSGKFTFPGLPVGTCLLDAGAEGYIGSSTLYSPSMSNYYSVSAGQTTGGCTITLRRGGSVSGKITSKVDGKPVANAEVVCFKGTSGYFMSTPAVSKADGTYRISGLEPGTYIPLVQYAPGFKGAYYPNTQDQEQAGEIQVEEGKETGSVNLQLTPTGGKGIIRGRIIDKTSGLPVAGIQVNLNKSYYDSANPIPLPLPVVDPVPFPEPGKAVIMRNRADAVSGAAPVNAVSSASAPQTGYATSGAATTTAGPEILSSGMAVTVTASDEPAISPLSSTSALLGYAAPYGMVSSPLDSPVSSRSYLPSLDYPRFKPVLTDEQGRFEFTGLENGSYELNIYDMSGKYLGTRYPEYPRGNWSEYTPDYLELSAQQPSIEGIEIALQKGGTLEGKVMAGSTPLAGISVSVISSGTGYKGAYGYPLYASSYYYGGGSQDMTDTDGEFVIRGLAEDGYMVLAVSQTGTHNYLPTFCLDQNAGEETPRTFKVTPGSTTSGIVITMKPGASISGRVVDKAGRPLAGIMMSADPEDYSSYNPEKWGDSYYYASSTNAVTAQDGTYTLAGLSKGTYILRAWDQNQKYLDGCQSGFTVSPPDQVSAPDMILAKSLILSGKVTSTDGTPLAEVMVCATLDSSPAGSSGKEPVRTANQQTGAYDSCSAYSSPRYQAQGYTGKDGTYQITGLMTGTYRLEAVDHTNGYLSAQYGTGSSPALVTGAEGEEKTGLDFRLSRGGIVKGRVYDQATGEPVSGLTVMARLMPSGEYSYPAEQTGSGGGYTGYATYGTSYVSPAGDSGYGYAVPEMTPEASMVQQEPDSDDGQGNLYIKDYRAQAGEEVEIPVVLQTGSHEVSSLGFEVIYDPGALEYLGFEKSKLASSLSMFDASLLDHGRIRIGGYSFTGSIPEGADDFLVLLKFRVGDGLLNQCYPLELENLMDDLAGFATRNGSFCAASAESFGSYPASMISATPILPVIPGGPVITPGGTVIAPTVVKPIEPPIVPTTEPPSISPLPPPPPATTSIMPTDYGRYPGYIPGQITYYYSTPTDSQGNYTLQGLPAGKYLLVISTTEKNYLAQYYPGVSSESEATPIEISADQVVENINFSLAPGIILKGVVKDAATGRPITTGCLVRLTTGQGLDIGRNTSTSSTGEYQFKGLRPGTCLVQATGCQYYHDGFYRLPGTDPKASSPVTISAPGPVEGIDILVQPKASISGRVVDEIDHQTPLARILITAIPSLYSNLSARYYYGYQAITDADGRYTINGLEEGDYLIMARDPAHVYGQEYYKDVPVNQPDKATAVHVARSEVRGGIDLELQVGETYTGTGSSQKQSTSGAYYGSSTVPGSVYGYSNYYLQATGSSDLYGGLAGYGAGLGGLDADRQAQWYASQTATAQNPAQSPIPPEQAPNTQPPEITSSNSVDRVKAGRTFTYKVEVKSSADNTPLKHSLLLGPEGMDIDPDTGLVQWTPSNKDAGSCIVQVMVDNGNGQVASQSFRLRVEEDKTPPEEVKGLTAVKGDRKVILSWIPAADRDGDLADQILYIREGQKDSTVISLGKNTSGYTVENLKNDQQYTFRIATVDKLENASTGVTVTATPGREQAATTVASPWSSWYTGLTATNYLFAGNTGTAGLWGTLPSLNFSSGYSVWPGIGMWGTTSPSWASSSWTSSSLVQSNNLFGSSNLWSSSSVSSPFWPGNTSALGLLLNLSSGTSLNSSAASSWLTNSSTGSWGGNSGTRYLWGSDNQDSWTRNLQSWYLLY